MSVTASTSYCVHCGTELPPGARFCPGCAASAPTEASPEERKLATVLFADLVGSTAHASFQDPERTRAQLNRFYDAMSEEIEGAGGTVEKFAGDSVMAVFGAPRALEDHAERSLHAALAMQARLGELFDGDQELRIGVNTGEVVVGSGRAGSSFVSGDSVNVAARLEQAAAPGEICVGERTVAIARGAFEFATAVEIEAKGKPEKLVTHRLVRALSRMRPRGVSGLDRVFVGREEELEHLMAAYRSAVLGRRPGLVTVLGDPGVGKTSLIRELWSRLAEEEPEPLRRTGRCLSYGTGTSYWPLGEVLREHLGVSEDDEPQVALERLGERSILGLSLGLDVARDLHPLAARDRLQDAWAGLLTDAVAVRPAVLLVEDIHWAEDHLLDLIEHVVGGAEGPLLVIATGRPELLERRPGWGARLAGDLVQLEPLSGEDSVRMLDELLASRPAPALCELIVDRAEGNPFFVEELVGVMIDRGLLARNQGRWVVHDLPSESAVPDSVHAVLAARIDLLGGSEKAALQAAAVMGRVFWTGPLYELVDGEPDLRVLEERDLIRRHADSAMAGQREYAIKHALTREVAYESVPRGQRARMHARFATWLERRAAGRDDLASLVAHHYAEAARRDSADLAWAGAEDELEQLVEKAVLWLERAAEFAVRRYEIQDALELLHRALGLEPDGETQAQLWRAVGTASALRFDGEAFWNAMENSLEICSDRATCADTYSELAFQTAIRSSMWARRPDPALVAGWVEHALHQSEPDSVARVRALIAQSYWDRRNGEPAREATELAEQAGDVVLRSYAWGAQAAVAFGEREFSTALKWSRRRLNLKEKISDPDHVAEIYELAIPSSAANGRLGEARRLAIDHDAIVAPLSDHHRLHGIAALLEVEELAAGWERILELAERTEEAVEANLATPCVRNARSLLVTALAAAHLGDDASAQRYERLASNVEPEGYEVVLSAPRTWLALLRGDLEELDRLQPTDVTRIQHEYALPTIAARLDALAALRHRKLVERDTPALLQPHTYLEPFAWRALGLVRNEGDLIERAEHRFAELGLTRHAERSQALLEA